jgi:hypothetical protein
MIKNKEARKMDMKKARETIAAINLQHTVRRGRELKADTGTRALVERIVAERASRVGKGAVGIENPAMGAVVPAAGKGFKTFEQAVAAYHAEGLSPAQAVAKAAKSHESLHTDYLSRVKIGTAERLPYGKRP